MFVWFTLPFLLSAVIVLQADGQGAAARDGPAAAARHHLHAGLLRGQAERGPLLGAHGSRRQTVLTVGAQQQPPRHRQTVLLQEPPLSGERRALVERH